MEAVPLHPPAHTRATHSKNERRKAHHRTREESKRGRGRASASSWSKAAGGLVGCYHTQVAHFVSQASLLRCCAPDSFVLTSPSPPLAAPKSQADTAPALSHTPSCRVLFAPLRFPYRLSPHLTNSVPCRRAGTPLSRPPPLERLWAFPSRGVLLVAARPQTHTRTQQIGRVRCVEARGRNAPDRAALFAADCRA